MYTHENILYFNEDFGNVVFSCNEMVILNEDLNNFDFDESFDEDDPDAINLVMHFPWNIKFEKLKQHKKK